VAVRSVTSMNRSDPAEVVRTFFDAWTSKEFAAAWPLLDDSIVVESPLAKYEDSATFKSALTGLASQVSAVKLLAALRDRDEAMMLYDLQIEGLGELRVFELSTVAEGKIKHVQQVYDSVEVRKAGMDDPTSHMA
jgi:hypothetical protein